MEQERFTVDVQNALQELLYWRTISQKMYGSYCNSIPVVPGDATASVGRSHSSEEVSVMDMERRASVIWSYYFKTPVVKQWNDGRRKDKIVSCK
ncbi:MAG: hypothetical protein M3040_01355 [Bacteroidota bacterium]|nr:hypothetical protein [Bacteroidota bacterium]